MHEYITEQFSSGEFERMNILQNNVALRKENLSCRLRDSLLTPVFFLIQLRRFNHADI